MPASHAVTSRAVARSESRTVGAGTLVWAIYCCLMLVAGLQARDLPTTDFMVFSTSAQAWRDGLPLYDGLLRGNMNPPPFVVLFAPFTWFPREIGFIVWTAVSALSFAASVRLIIRSRQWSLTRAVWFVMACLGTMPGLLNWQQGQIAFLLMYPFTRAWLARSPAIAGLWLAPVTLIKPPLALAVLFLPATTWLTAGLGTVVLAFAFLPLTGVQAWVDWLGQAGAVEHLGHPLNASLWGTMTRIAAGDLAPTSLSLLTRPMIVGGLAALSLVAWLTWRRTAGDARWAGALFVATLASPLGWSYYLPVALGAIGSSIRLSTPVLIGAGIFAIPAPILWRLVPHTPMMAALVGSAYGIAVVLWWIGLVRHAESA